jgi:hypothetical protein
VPARVTAGYKVPYPQPVADCRPQGEADPNQWGLAGARVGAVKAHRLLPLSTLLCWDSVRCTEKSQEREDTFWGERLRRGPVTAQSRQLSREDRARPGRMAEAEGCAFCGSTAHLRFACPQRQEHLEECCALIGAQQRLLCAQLPLPLSVRLKMASASPANSSAKVRSPSAASTPSPRRVAVPVPPRTCQTAEGVAGLAL